MAPHYINYSLWVFYSGFLGAPVNIKDLGAADRPDVLHRSHLTDLSGIQPVPPPLLIPLAFIRHLCQAAGNSGSLPGL